MRTRMNCSTKFFERTVEQSAGDETEINVLTGAETSEGMRGAREKEARAVFFLK
jgi:hypothetical protein